MQQVPLSHEVALANQVVQYLIEFSTDSVFGALKAEHSRDFYNERLGRDANPSAYSLR